MIHCKIINFTNTEEDRKFQEETIIPYWERRSTRYKIINSMTPEWRAAYEAGIFTEFMEQRGPGHTVGSQKIYTKGFLDYKQDIQDSMDKLIWMPMSVQANSSPPSSTTMAALPTR